MLNFIKNTFILLITLTMLSSCISSTDKYGYMFELSDADLLKEGVTTKDGVLRLMGSPTLISDINNEETWIYYSQETKKMLFFKPNIVARNILVLTFNDEELIKSLQKFDLSDESNLKFSSNYTKVKSNQNGLFKSLISNIGKVSAK